MPRKAKTLSGAPAQPVGPVAGQEYGAGVEQIALQQQLPAPQAPSGVPAQALPTPASPAGEQPQRSLADAIARMPVGQGLLGPDSAAPNVPVTNGLASGPGAGPEVLQRPPMSPLSKTLADLTRITGDPMFEQLARKNNLG